MRVVGYIRVSTDKQAEEGLGLEVQEAELRRWAKAHGHRLVDVVRDEGRSGAADVAARPGLAEALAMLASGRRAVRPAGEPWAEALAVARLDRLARDLVLQEQLLAEVRRVGGRVMSCVAGEAGYLEDDPHDPSRALIRQVLGAVAQYERAMIRLRLMAGRQRKAERGGYAGGGRPFGYRTESAELVADVDEQATLERIHELRSAGASLRSIAQTLTDEGRRPRRAERWHPEVVRGILARTA